MGAVSIKQGRTTKHFYFGDAIRKKNFGKEMLIVSRPIIYKEEFYYWKRIYDEAHDMNRDALFIP